MVRPIYNKDEFHPFNLWLNSHNGGGESASGCLNPSCYGFTFTDVDFVFMADRNPEILVFCVELKSYGKFAKDQRGQDAVLSLNHAIYQLADGSEVECDLWGRKATRTLRYLGSHRLTLSGASPEDSEWMTWNGDHVDARTLVKILRFTLSPFLESAEPRHTEDAETKSAGDEVTERRNRRKEDFKEILRLEGVYSDYYSDGNDITLTEDEVFEAMRVARGEAS